MQSAISKLESERAEVNSILASGVFGRTNNLVRLLTFVCDKYFEGAIDEIKEYSIAVNALGRPDSFDPQVDTIVRVTAHALRKRLEEYYRSAGAEHAVHICLPSGHYVPKFIHTSDLETATGESTLDGKRNGQPLHGPSAREKGVAEGNLESTLEPSHGPKASGVAEDQLCCPIQSKIQARRCHIVDSHSFCSLCLDPFSFCLGEMESEDRTRELAADRGRCRSHLHSRENTSHHGG